MRSDLAALPSLLTTFLLAACAVATPFTELDDLRTSDGEATVELTEPIGWRARIRREPGVGSPVQVVFEAVGGAGRVRLDLEADGSYPVTLGDVEVRVVLEGNHEPLREGGEAEPDLYIYGPSELAPMADLLRGYQGPEGLPRNPRKANEKHLPRVYRSLAWPPAAVVRMDARGRITEDRLAELEWAGGRFRLYMGACAAGTSDDEQYYLLLDRKARRFSFPKHIFTATVWHLRGCLLGERLLFLGRDTAFEFSGDRIEFVQTEGRFGLEDVAVFLLDERGLVPVTADGRSWLEQVQGVVHRSGTPADPEREVLRLTVGAPLPPAWFRIEGLEAEGGDLLVRLAGSSDRIDSMVEMTWRVAGGDATLVETKVRPRR